MGADAQRVVVDISMSLDGFIAGPNPTLEEPLGTGGERLHEWILGLASWRERHGESGGARNADDEVVAESLAATGAVVMGRRMFSGGEGAWEDDPNADGWWGDTPPFQAPVFVVTHHAREPMEMSEGTTFTFVTDGVESAVEQAREAASEKNVLVAGGASLAQQVLGAGLLGVLQIHLTPVLLGGGTRLLEHVDRGVRLESTRVIESPAVTHLRFDVFTSA